MITREQFVELASFESGGADAVSFYFQPSTPQDRSHRAEAILAKDLVRAALRAGARNGNGASLRADLVRILELAESLHGNHTRAKAVFACAARDFWREYDLPPRLRSSDLVVNPRFRVKPLACALDGVLHCAIALIDREKARVFDLRFGEINERLGLFNELPRRGRSDVSARPLRVDRLGGDVLANGVAKDTGGVAVGAGFRGACAERESGEDSGCCSDHGCTYP